MEVTKTGIQLEKVRTKDDYFLKFIVEDPYVIKVNLFSPKDPTKVDTNDIERAEHVCYRHKERDSYGQPMDKPKEEISEFVSRAIEETNEWVGELIKKYKETQKIADELSKQLNS